MIEKEFRINASGNDLSGSMCLPGEEGRFPFVLMVHGSGPLDRDENMAAQKLNVFNTIAHCLAQSGIASLRYDKRGCGRSSGNYYTAGHYDLVRDAMHAFDALRELEICDRDRVFMLGHSEGCIIAPQINLKRAEVAGLILLCPFADNMESILIKQATQLQKEFESAGLMRRVLGGLMGVNVESQRKLIHKLKTSQVDTFRDRLQTVPAKSLRELLGLDPVAIFSQVNRPVLLIGGEKDLQCEPGDVHKIAALVNGPVEARVLENLTHVLRFDERPASILGSAELLARPIEPVIPELITLWLRRHIQ